MIDLCMGGQLTEEDFRRLNEESWIDRETALAAGLRRFDRFSGAEIVGRRDGERVDYSGIGFPYFLPGQTRPHTWRLRRDHPDHEMGKNGRPKPVRKYLMAPGARNRVYFPPRAATPDLCNPELPILFTEGEKKTLSLHRLSLYAADQRRFLVIGVPGVWSWRGITGKTSDANGNRTDVKGVISDLDLVRWDRRFVLLAFDKDCRTNESVRIASAALAKELRRRRAIVKMFDIPEEAECSGADDLLAIWGPERVLERIEVAFESDDAIQAGYYLQAGSYWRNSTTRDGATHIQLTNFQATISAVVVEDDGLEEHRRFEIETIDQADGHRRFVIPATEFANMTWPMDKIGPQAIVYPNQKDHARTAIQSLSGVPPEKVVFTHTGWREIQGKWVYLHAAGAIGESGNVDGVIVKLHGAISRYELLLPSSNDELAAIQTSLDLLELAKEIMYPLLAAVYRSVVKMCDFVVHVVGPSGAYKTALAALLQQHFGAAMDERNLPGSWSSTANALEMLAYSTKDALVVVDDFSPKGTIHDVQRLNAVAERLIRAAGNHSGRGRLTMEGDLRECKPPRGLILSTGEDIPRGHSVRARVLILELTKGDINLPLLTKLQTCGGCGLLSQAMAGFLRWLARDYSARRTEFEEQVSALRSQLPSTGHARTPAIQANLQAAFEMFVLYAYEKGAIKEDRARELKSEFRAALRACVTAQEQVQAAAEPTAVYFDLLTTALSTKRAHFASVAGGPPDEAEIWGWERKPGGLPNEWHSPGTCIGWIENDNLYLEPDAAFYIAQDTARITGENISITARTLNKRLDENKLLLDRDDNRRTYRIRKTVGGMVRPVLHLSLAKFTGNHH
jgi:Domain of unknown function (DUF3854)/Domain of unknown function (DUF927)